jgi:hypothetical protein
LREATAGEAKRQSDQLDLAAWAVSHLLQPYLKKGHRLTPQRLLGRGAHTQQQKEEGWKQIEQKLNRDKMN